MALARIVFAVPYGVVFLTDFDNRATSPDWRDDDEVVAAVPSAIRIRVIHGQVGLLDFRILAGPNESGDKILLYEGDLSLEFGRLWLSDANEESSLVVGVKPGLRHVTVYGDAIAPWPTQIDCFIDRP